MEKVDRMEEKEEKRSSKLRLMEERNKRDMVIRMMMKSLLKDIDKALLIGTHSNGTHYEVKTTGLIKTQTALDFYKCGLEHGGVPAGTIEALELDAKYELKREKGQS